jgi:hypothetical protein
VGLRKGACGSLWLFLIVGVANGASAGEAPEGRPASSRLNYSLGKGADLCADEATLTAEVRSRLGYDPFGEPARLVLSASIRRVGDSLLGSLKMADAEGKPLGAKSFQAGATECAELIAEMELAICLVIDPLESKGEARPPATPPPAPGGVAAAAAPPPPPTPGPENVAQTEPEPPPRASAPAQAYLEATVSMGSAPSAAPGLTLGGAMRFGALLLALEGRADLSESLSTLGGEVSVSLLAVVLAPCLTLGPFGGCAVILVGSEEVGASNLPDSRKTGVFFSAAGARLFYELPLGSRIFLRANADVLAALTVVAIQVSPVEVWRNPPVALTLGLGVGTSFP